MSSKKVWEIWCPGRKVMEQISVEIPNIAARFFFNDFCAIYSTEPSLYDSEMLNEDNKWVAIKSTRWNRIGKCIYFHSPDYKAFPQAIMQMIGYLKEHPRP